MSDLPPNEDLADIEEAVREPALDARNELDERRKTPES